MLVYILRRLLGMIPLLIGITLVCFVVINLAPGKPTDIQAQLNPKITKEARERLRAFYGLDKPLHIRYLIWLKKLARVDFGSSFSDGRQVIVKIRERIPITLIINALAMLIIILVAIPIGVFSAVHQNTFFDKSTTVFVFLGFAMPTFWLALLCMLLFGVYLDWLPISGVHSLDYSYMGGGDKLKDLFRHLTLPVLISAFGGLAAMSRYMRSNMLEVLRQNYIITARAKGLPEWKVIYRHALRNALLPVITILGLAVPGLIGGSVIFETIFAIPGMGQLFFDSVMRRDYPVIMGVLFIGAVLTLLGNLLADIGYALADPRIRTE